MLDKFLSLRLKLFEKVVSSHLVAHWCDGLCRLLYPGKLAWRLDNLGKFCSYSCASFKVRVNELN